MITVPESKSSFLQVDNTYTVKNEEVTKKRSHFNFITRRMTNTLQRNLIENNRIVLHAANKYNAS